LSDTEQAVSGGCQCGRVRYEVKISDADAYLCHCRMCQRATGGISIVYKSVVADKLSWLSEPDWYESSPFAHRPFCAKCGTPLGFAFKDGSGMDVTIGSLDDPTPYAPVHHFGVEHLHEAWIDTSDLPRKRASDYEKLQKKWAEAGGAPE
jgi:hypothetical protein